MYVVRQQDAISVACIHQETHPVGGNVGWLDMQVASHLGFPGGAWTLYPRPIVLTTEVVPSLVAFGPLISSAWYWFRGD